MTRNQYCARLTAVSGLKSGGGAFQVAVGRPARPEEKTFAAELLERQTKRYQTARKGETPQRALAHVCQMLLNSSEFLYVH